MLPKSTAFIEDFILHFSSHMVSLMCECKCGLTVCSGSDSFPKAQKETVEAHFCARTHVILNVRLRNTYLDRQDLINYVTRNLKYYGKASEKIVKKLKICL